MFGKCGGGNGRNAPQTSLPRPAIPHSLDTFLVISITVLLAYLSPKADYLAHVGPIPKS